MKPIREIVVREYLPGSYTVEEEGRTYDCPSRESLYIHLRRELGGLSDPDDVEKIESLEQALHHAEEDIDYLKERADA